MKRWYVVYTQVNRERDACSHLCRQGFDVYLPQYQKTRRHARKSELVPKPLFPRYMFVYMNLENMRWRAINSTHGVVQLICLGEEPTPVPNGLVENIRKREDEKGWVVPDISEALMPGDTVQVVSGAMRDLIGIFQSKGDADRVVVLFNLMGREMKIALPGSTIWSPS